MTDSKDKKATTEPIEEAIDEGVSGEGSQDSGATEGTDPAGDGHGAALVEPAQEAVLRLQAELDSLKDRHLRVVAEYDNFRKRTSKERTETWGRAQADVVANLLDGLDDLGRVADLDAQVTSAADVIKGVELVERKLLRELESAGLERVGEPGERFDPNVHEAVGSLNAESPEADQTVGAVLQTGYRFGGVLIRPARVQVKMWQGGGAEG